MTVSCVAGAGCCPPEDVGGVSGYHEFLRVLLTPDQDEADEQKHLQNWVGGSFDPFHFDLENTDAAVRRAIMLRRAPDPPDRVLS